MNTYSTHIAWSPADNMFVAVCQELGNISALGHTRVQAAAELGTAIEEALDVYKSEGWKIPGPIYVKEA